jgi:Flp pilus assembly secretin CpaC
MWMGGCESSAPELPPPDQDLMFPDEEAIVSSADAEPEADDAERLLRDMVAAKRTGDLVEEDAESRSSDDARDASAVDSGGQKEHDDVPSLLLDDSEDDSTETEDGDFSEDDTVDELADLLGEDRSASPAVPLEKLDPEDTEVVSAPKSTPPESRPTLRSPPAEAAPDAEPTSTAFETQPETAAETRPKRAEGQAYFYNFFHKTCPEFIRFLRDGFPDLVDSGHVLPVEGKSKNAIFFGDDTKIQEITTIADNFDDMALELRERTIRPRYMSVIILMEALSMAGIANVWSRVDETVTTQRQEGKKVTTIGTHKHRVYAQSGIAHGQTSPRQIPKKIPYVFELPFVDPIHLPRQSTGRGTNEEQLTIEFNESSSTERRGVLVVVGTDGDVARVEAFLEMIDRPARQIMIEVQVIQLSADKLTDLGIDSISAGGNNSVFNFATPFPGENIVQPGAPGFRDPTQVVPDVVSEGLGYIFDDTSTGIEGRFLANIHALVRTGDAKIKARPKILTLDDRPSMLHIGEEVPTFQSTSVTRDSEGGRFIENVNNVATQYVGFTLNMRPRISGENDDEVALQLEVVANQLQGRERVFEEDLLGVPIIARRWFAGQSRVKNHRPIILGGLITEEEIDSASKVPILGDIPGLKFLFGRHQKERRRTEVILVVTPHILSETGWDRVATPKESIHFDTFDSVLFNDRYIIKGRDVWGIDPITKQPADFKGEIFTESEVIDLTLLNIVKKRELVTKLGVFNEYVPEEANKLGWLQRRYPERSVYYWPPEEKEIYYKAAAIVIENIKELNPDMDYEEIVLPRREIVLPTTPYRMALSYDKIKIFADKGAPVLREGEIRVTEETVKLVREVGMKRGMRQFADYIRRSEIKAEAHGELRHELQRLYSSNLPQSTAADTDDYAEVFQALADARIDFITLAGFFRENLRGRYKATEAPDIGLFEYHLKDFVASAVSISERAKRLIKLEDQWQSMSTE